jgi:hypothetical protein
MPQGIDLDGIKYFAEVAAPAGLAIGVFLYIGKDILARNIFPMLNRSQAYRVILSIAFMAWSLAIVAIVAWAYVKIVIKDNPEDKSISMVLDPTGFKEIGPFSPNTYDWMTVTGRWSPGLKQPYIGPEGSSRETLNNMPKWAVVIEEIVPATGEVFTYYPYYGDRIPVHPNLKLRFHMNDEPFWMVDNVNDPDNPMRVIFKKN